MRDWFKRLLGDNVIRAAWIGAAAALFGAAALAYVGYLQYRVQREQLELERDKATRERDAALVRVATYEQAYEDAPQKFTRRLGELIDAADASVERKGDPNDIIVKARTLVAARKDVVNTLSSFSEHLDSDFDRLQGLLATDTAPDIEQISETIEVLKGKWPIKKDQIELDVRVLRTQLGLIPVTGPSTTAKE